MTEGFPANWRNEVVRYDAETQRRIGGYPRTAWVRDPETGRVYRSLVNHNVMHPSDAMTWTLVTP